MNKRGPIIVIEDDEDDLFLFSSAFKALARGNELVFFSDAERALDYMNKMDDLPFLIISDINMPKMNGFELRDKVHNNPKLNVKCIPYIFLSTAVSKAAVMEAYSLSIQGFFIKPADYNGFLKTITDIVTYWDSCYSPTSFAA